MAVGLLVVFSLGVQFGNGRLEAPGVTRGSQSNLPENLDYTTVEDLYDTLRANYDGKLDEQKLLDGIKSGLAQSTGDPYTEYMNQAASKAFADQLSGTFTGIGAELGKDSNNNVVVVSPISGFPAEKAGLRPRDVISSIDGKSSLGVTTDEAVSKIRGPEGTKVTLKVIRNAREELTFEITRATINVPSVTSEIREGNIGYIKISRYGEDTTQLSRAAADQFKAANVKGVILDLRGNGGGLLDEAVGISSLWLDSSQTVLQEKRDGRVTRTYNPTGNPTFKGVPTVVLINEGSASASEITAGALADNQAATLIGIKSFGKGSVQQVINFNDGSEVKVTIARWFTPKGRNIDKQGIEPNQKVELTEDDFKNGRDPQLDAATTFLNK